MRAGRSVMPGLAVSDSAVAGHSLAVDCCARCLGTARQSREHAAASTIQSLNHSITQALEHKHSSTRALGHSVILLFNHSAIQASNRSFAAPGGSSKRTVCMYLVYIIYICMSSDVCCMSCMYVCMHVSLVLNCIVLDNLTSFILQA